MTNCLKETVRHRKTLLTWLAFGAIWMIVNLVLYQLFDRREGFENEAAPSITPATPQIYAERQITVPFQRGR